MRSRTPKVIFYSSQLLPTSHAAAAVRGFHLARAMRAAGLNLEVWSHSADTESRKLVLPLMQNRWPTPLRMLHELAIAVEIVLRLCWVRLRSADVIVVLSSPPFVACFVVASASRALGFRYVWDARDVYPEVLFNFGVLSHDGRVGRWLSERTRSIYEHALFVSTPSDAFAATIARQLPTPDAVKTVRNGFDETLFIPVAETSARGRPFTCVNHGLLGRMHDIELLLHVATLVHRSAPEIRFVVAGYGPKEDLLRSQTLPNVRYLGHVAYEDIPSLLTESDLGLAFIEDNAGTDGAFPVKVYEYMGAGLPIIVTPLSEAGRLARDRGLGVAFAAGSAEEIAGEIVELSGRGARYREMRARVLAVRAEYGRGERSREFAEHLRRVLAVTDQSSSDR